MNDTQNELAGRVALVTGSGRNIGRAIALQLAAGGAGVAVNVRSNKAEADAVVREIKAKGGKAAVFVADIADPQAVEGMVAAVVEHFGGIDYLINNAAMRREKALDQMTFAEWREVMGTTLDGVFLCVKACLRALKTSGAGAIVNIGGLSAYTGSKHRAHVVAAKAGLIGLTRALAHDLADDGITANLVSPGLIGTPRAAGSPEPQHHLIHSTLTGERGAPEEVAYAVRFLCGPGARYITGQQIQVNGGAFMG
jgi:3-oxoacyl-[acyl-carrier protein] reductase